MVHEYLAVAVPAGADADRRYRDRVGDHPGHAVGDALEHDREAPGLGQRNRVVDDPRAASSCLPCTLNPPIAWIDWGVRPRWPMTGISLSRIALDRVEALAATFELDRTGTRADELRCVAHRLLARHVVAHPRQIADDERVRLGPSDRTHVMGHVVGGDLERVVVAEHDHREGVADEDHVDPGAVHHPGARRVVRGDHHQRASRTLGRAISGAVIGRDRGRDAG